jgi:hypothetical protein
MGLFRVPFAPPKGRWPKSERKRAKRRRLLEKEAEYKKAVRHWREGSSGAASPVRRIDPVTGEITEVIRTKVQGKRRDRK